MKFSIKSCCLFVFPLACLSAPTLAQANDCEAIYVKDHKSQWTYLNNSCDIGTGLWGHKPKKMVGKYWVQCGYGEKQPSEALSNKIRSLFPRQSFILREGGNYRCLVGTFNSYDEAKNARFLLRGNGLPDSFIRQVTSNKVPKKVTAVKKKPSNFSLALPKDEALVDKTMKASPKQKQPIKVIKPTRQKMSSLPLMTYANIDNTFATNTIAYSFSVEDTRFYFPQNLPVGKNEMPKFMAENNKYWIGTTWKQSHEWCDHFGLRLPTTKELMALIKEGQAKLIEEKWPKAVSYWSSDMMQDKRYRSVDLKTGRLKATDPNTPLYATCVIQ